jgi:hypothetical protein
MTPAQVQYTVFRQSRWKAYPAAAPKHNNICVIASHRPQFMLAMLYTQVVIIQGA